MELVFIFILYLFIAFIPTLVGAMAGLGGGIIIKPVLDAAGHYDLATIGMLSASTVLAMAAVSLLKSRKTTTQLDVKVSAFIAIGSIVGGIIGKGLFNFLVINLDLESIIGMVQSIILALLLVGILVYFKCANAARSFAISNKWLILAAGLVLGLFSAFLGIGGGPLNIAVLSLLFAMSVKERVINSTFIIFFSQLSSILLVAITTGFHAMDLTMLPWMIIGGVIGGWVGSTLLVKISDVHIGRIFNITITLIILLNIYNVLVVVV